MPQYVPTRVSAHAMIGDGFNPAKLADTLNCLRHRNRYADAQAAFMRVLFPADFKAANPLLQILAEDRLGLDTRTRRVSIAFGIIGLSHLRLADYWTFEKLIAATENRAKARRAWRALHALGYARSARGIVPVESCIGDARGSWPASAEERAALCAGLLVRAFRGESFAAVRLVRP